MRTTSSSSAGGGDTEYVHLTKAQVEDVIKYLGIVNESEEDVKRTAMAAANKLQKQRDDMVAAKDALESYIKEL